MEDLFMEESFIGINNKYDSNIFVYHCGWEKCKPKHSYGPAVRDHYLIHFIKEGKGKFYIGDRIYEINKNEGFLICPNDVTYYEADEITPWNYLWVGFNGIKATQYLNDIGLSKFNPVVKPTNSKFILYCLDKLLESSQGTRGREIKMLGYLYLFLSTLTEESTPIVNPNYKDEYIQKAIEYVDMNYSRDITINGLAKFLGLNRSYFSSMFKKSLNISPQKFIIQYKINKACELMKQHDNLSIGDISRSVGYYDQLVFSKTFKRIKGCSPSDYRRELGL